MILRMLWPRNAVLVALMICSAVICSAPIALAEPSEEEQNKGRELATTALELYQKEQYADALTKFAEAEKLYPTAQVLRMEGYTLIALKRFAEAADVLERALKSDFKPLLPADAEDAEDQLNAALKNVGTVIVRSSVESATVRIDDGEPRPMPQTVRLTVGSHRFVVEAPDHDAREESRNIVAGEATLRLNPTPKKVEAAPEPEQKPEAADETPKKPTNPFGGWFPGQRNVGVVMASVGLVASGTALGVGIYGLQLEGAVQTNIDFHNQNYDPSCSANSAFCRADIALINYDAERAAKLRNAALATGLVGAGLTVLGGLFVSFAPDGPFAPKKDVAKPKESAFAIECGVTGLGGACGGSF